MKEFIVRNSLMQLCGWARQVLNLQGRALGTAGCNWQELKLLLVDGSSSLNFSEVLLLRSFT